MMSRVKCKYGGSGCGGGESVPGGISSNKIEQTKPNELHRTKAKQSKTKSKSTTVAHVHVLPASSVGVQKVTGSCDYGLTLRLNF